MFREFHVVATKMELEMDSDNRITINTNHIENIIPLNGMTGIKTRGNIIFVTEPYDEVKRTLYEENKIARGK